MLNRFILFSLVSLLSLSAIAQFSSDNYSVSAYALDEERTEFRRDEFLVNVRVFEFDSRKLEPWIEGITHLRAFGVDFRKGKGSDGLYQYVDEAKMNEFISFAKSKNLKVIWTLNLTSFTLEKELAYVDNLISKGLNIVGFQYGGEFWLKKYAYGEMNAKGVVERVRMDGQNRDYLNLLDMWVPEVTAKYPLGKYLHIFVTASTTSEKNLTQNYRREFNQKVFDYVTGNSELKGKVDFSYHLYAGAKPTGYSKDEESVTKPNQVDWSFISKIPSGSRWVVTESGYYTQSWSDEQLKEARDFYTMQSQKLGEDALMGIHVLYIADKGQNPLALYNLNGRTKVGENIDYWLRNESDADINESDSSDGETSEDQNNSTNNNSQNTGEPTLVSISPKYTGWFQWIHFSHTLTFSNGKSYKRSYWFSSPDFSKDDLGKPLSYFKRVVKSK
jgi:hypothetical protein